MVICLPNPWKMRQVRLPSYLPIGERIKQLSSSLHIYQEAALTSVFLKECMQCLDDLKIWQIPLSVLSEQEEAHAERKTILTAFVSN